MAKISDNFLENAIRQHNSAASAAEGITKGQPLEYPSDYSDIMEYEAEVKCAAIRTADASEEMIDLIDDLKYQVTKLSGDLDTERQERIEAEKIQKSHNRIEQFVMFVLGIAATLISQLLIKMLGLS